MLLQDVLLLWRECREPSLELRRDPPDRLESRLVERFRSLLLPRWLGRITGRNLQLLPNLQRPLMKS